MFSETFVNLLLVGLIICALFATLCKRMFTTVLIYMSYSLVMTLVWLVLEAPDLAETEAAVGAGVTTLLFLIVLRKMQAIETQSRKHKDFGFMQSDFSEEVDINEDEKS